jgi:small GTP-binding protein
VVVGSASVGKTSLINRIVDSRFEPLTTPTTGTAFYQLKTDHQDHPEIQLWDTAGMERYRSVNSVYYREAVAAILVFDMTNFQSFQESESWLNEFITHAQPNPAVVLCGNKADLAEAFEVEEDQIQSFANQHELRFFQVSAATGESVIEMVRYLIQALPVTQTPVSTTLILTPERKRDCEC